MKALVISEPDFTGLLLSAPHLRLKLLRTLAERGVLAFAGGTVFAQ